ncbi:ABC transporter permease [Nocardioides zhouii]|uniref:ABC transporter permease n=1 Tax=Nocardioides zhouii TaxID=1168729 RepID=UPI001A92A600|nr:ABC transporter permease [Nocardioides zhouii]
MRGVTDRLRGTGLLLRFALRRDRVLVPVWVLLLTATVVASAAATGPLYATAGERVAAAEALNASPAIVALYGPILDTTSLGELSMTKMTVLYAVFVAFMSVVVVRRHTRVEEETGRAELVGATAVGADAPVAAALLEAALASLLVGTLAAVGNIACGLPAMGSVLFGASWAGIGHVGAGIAVLSAQLSSSARTVGFIASAVVGVLYVLRAIGDTSASWLSWLTPFGWGTQLSAWSEPRAWLLVGYPVLALVLTAAGLALRRRRDLGAGVLPDRPGPARGAPRLGDALALVWRQQRTGLAGWTVGIGAIGIAMGSIVPGIGDLLDTDRTRPIIEAMGGVGGLQDSLVFALASVVAVVITCFGIGAVTRAAGDEHDGRTETVLATATSRAAVLVAVASAALLGSTWLLLVSGAATAVGRGDGVGAVGAALVQAPAVWVVLAVALLLLSVRSRWAVAGWAVLAACVTLGQVGAGLELPDWVLGLSPFHHVPKYPAEAFAWTPELLMTALTALVLGVAWTRYRSRDIG